MPRFQVIIKQLPSVDETLNYGSHADTYSVTDGGVLTVSRANSDKKIIFSPTGWSRLEVDASEAVPTVHVT
jgi:hypothetical protein